MHSLERRISFFDAFFLEVGGIIGAGVFVLLGIATGLSGPSIVLSVAIAGFVSLVTALSYAEVSSAMPVEGGDYEYAYELISPLAGMLVGAGWLVADVMSSAVVSVGFAAYFTTLFPVSVKLSALAVVFLVTAVNVLGVELGTRTNKLISLLKIAVLCLFIFISLSYFKTGNFSNFAPNGATGVLGGAALFFFAFSGFGKIARLGGEVVEPKKTLPLSILSALSLSTLLYLLTSLALVGSVGWVVASSSNSPLSTSLSFLGHHSDAFLITIGALAATLSVLLTNNLGTSRVLYALARRNKSMRLFGNIHERFKTPWVAVILVGFVTGVIVLTLDLNAIAGLSSFLFLVYYGAVNFFSLTARKKKNWSPRFRTPLHPLFPIIGLVSCGLLALALLTGFK